MLETGSIFADRYRILDTGKKGGMGCVYLSEDITDKKHYAIKEQKVTPANRELIRSEISIQKKLNHPALPKVEKVREEGEFIYIVMEYIQGRTLSEILKEQGKIPEERALKWAVAISDILQYLHGLDRPVVYRDMKPSNIMIDAEDCVHLIDFGIAQEYENVEEWGKKKVALTRGYAAPEQYDAKYRSDVRTDIYALGVTLHYLLTGKNPTKPPYHFVKVRKLDKRISYGMEAIIFRCLQPAPDDRYCTAGELYEELCHIDELNRKLAARHRKKCFLAGAGLMAVAVGLFIWSVMIFRGRSNSVASYYLLLDKARTQMDQGEYTQADAILREAIEKEPEAEDAYLAMAEWYMRQENYEECFHYISEEILTRFPDIYGNADFLQLMWRLYMEQGKPEEASYYLDELNRLKGRK